ncbi:MAG: HAD family hydrolase [Elusimicrobia bacterium]|nr:HAD family hydrolase [Elusimicrobiota bacterium]
MIAKALLFDYGGTLDSDGTTWLERFSSLYKEAGLDFPPHRFERAFYDADDNLAARHPLKGLDLEQTALLQVRDVFSVLAPERSGLAAPLARRFSADCRRHFSKLRPVLERLSARYRLGIVSNFYGNLEGLLRAEGLLDLFSVIADSGDLGVAKPDPAIFLHAAKGVDADPRDCVMVGDSVNRDMKGAASVFMKTALIAPAPDAPRAGQDWTIRSALELESLFLVPTIG